MAKNNKTKMKNKKENKNFPWITIIIILLILVAILLINYKTGFAIFGFGSSSPTITRAVTPLTSTTSSIILTIKTNVNILAITENIPGA